VEVVGAGAAARVALDEPGVEGWAVVPAAGQALVVSNWLVGPSGGVAVAFLVAVRMGPEERMLLEEFGKEYEAYRATTKRLIPGVW
jgi:protein-S-isoprenylcysteine O-methyltransferase Ste14